MEFALRLKSETEAALMRVKSRYPQAVSRALNRSIVSSRASMSSDIAKDMKLRVGVVRDLLEMQNATPARLVARLKAPLKRPSLLFFDAKGPEPSRGQGRGVTAKTQTRKYPHAFIATMKSGHRGVFQRKGKARLGIYSLKGPSIGHVFDKHLPKGLAKGQESLAKNLRSELRFAISKTA